MRIHVYSLFTSLEEGTKQLHDVIEAEPMETGWMCKVEPIRSLCTEKIYIALT